jgi:hypothetical protein
MKYMLIHAVEESRLDDLPPQVETELTAWVEEMLGRGIELDGSRLYPVSDATTVRAPAGRVQVTDGPFAETKEQIAGYDVIDCPDLDTAVAVAAAHPTLHVGAIEVRPFDEGMSDPEVPRLSADGKRRYLMLVCADMRQAMADDVAHVVRDASPDLWDPPDPERPAAPDEPDESDGPDDVERWIAEAGPRRIYGWPLELPSRAVTVRRVDGSVVTTDGPFAETKEQVGGFDLLECSDLDDAIAVAAGHPVAEVGVLELRPLRA